MHRASSVDTYIVCFVPRLALVPYRRTRRNQHDGAITCSHPPPTLHLRCDCRLLRPRVEMRKTTVRVASARFTCMLVERLGHLGLCGLFEKVAIHADSWPLSSRQYMSAFTKILCEEVIQTCRLAIIHSDVAMNRTLRCHDACCLYTDRPTYETFFTVLLFLVPPSLVV